ncbi:hypothetical protein Jab_1c04990 [Janthinobacterium sp. HH01]|uniref:hypothetical protein n=1 Tax=Janthinobacterium sp. HH01 TaxID=1198452 RepID=UPI0002AECB31|nr:hypothetical protein [Janthinobacterium sp. HH01]ELX11911.1 hypothetical protein Jab_1c04990 [Janthinobacterium sp. HH01]
MKISVKSLAVAFIGACLLTPLHAENNDALWKSVTAQLEVSRQWAAGVIDIASDIDKGNGIQHASATMHLSAWDKQKPVYTLIKAQPADAKGADMKFLNAITALSGSMTEGEAPTRTDGVSLDGVMCTVFETHFSQAMSKGTMKLWVDAALGKPRKMALSFHMPLMADGTVITQYAIGAQGQVLPAAVDYDMEILIPFRKGKARIQQTLSAWVAQPPSDGAPSDRR